MSNSDIRILESPPLAKEYNHLRTLCDWFVHPEEYVKFAIDNSLYWVSIYDRDHLIGMGRIVGDGRLCFYIQDVIVAPCKQRQGFGGLVMDKLMKYLHDNAAKNAYIGLMCKKGMSRFYEQYGFISRPNEQLGPGMVLRNFDPLEIKDYRR